MARPTRFGILGRRRHTPKQSEDGAKLLARQLASPDPLLWLLAAEASRARNAAPEALP
jgi:hypothetical protein